MNLGALGGEGLGKVAPGCFSVVEGLVVLGECGQLGELARWLVVFPRIVPRGEVVGVQ